MSRTSSQSSVRSIRRSVRWFTLKEYVGGALWVLPSVAALLALAVGYGISQIEVGLGSRLNWVAFQGTADDARVRPLGTKIINGPGGRGHVLIPGNNFADYIFFIGGLFGRYGSSDLIVMLALLRLFETVAEVLPPGSARLAVLDRAAVEALADAERSIPRQPSLERIRAAVAALRSKINSLRSLAVEET